MNPVLNETKEDIKQTEEFQLELIGYGYPEGIKFDDEPTNPILQYVYFLRNKGIESARQSEEYKNATRYLNNMFHQNVSIFEKETMWLIADYFDVPIDSQIQMNFIRQWMVHPCVYNPNNHKDFRTFPEKERMRYLYSIFFNEDDDRKFNDFSKEMKDLYNYYKIPMAAVFLMIMYDQRYREEPDKIKSEQYLEMRDYYINLEYEFVIRQLLHSRQTNNWQIPYGITYIKSFQRFGLKPDYRRLELLGKIFIDFDDKRRKELERLKIENEELKTQIRYAPGGEGMREAEKSFENCLESFQYV